jgi:hypothetical protein
MKTITIGVSSLDELEIRTKAAFEGKFQGSRLSFI